MSIDYDANYGIGYGVYASEEIADTEALDSGLGNYIDEEIRGGFEWFEAGNTYIGSIDGVFLTVTDPFKNGLDLTSVKAQLDAEIERLKLETSSEFGAVGGMYVS